MTHWSEHFIGIPHAQLDCGQFVERVLREQFGRNVRFPRRERDDLVHRSALIVEHVPEFAVPIDEPVDGCGVLMWARGRRAHIGLYVVIDGQAYVLHSDQAMGASILSPLNRLPAWYRIEGFYAWR
ncbi:TPA: hypothetical protein QDC22_007502 [Burkholderia stabilis]|nr:hypothetical protein [Burkholderia stabilis]HDR9589113.1 hypothetical protein [Burkholderia stabilis]HDR9649509.1 hypothetical protein [Burkholderia stabilis]HDR9653575.1 hypothetical protein [Burkholderia stabilis]HDR9656270.1 hypothetical protein [Burkholderia stabilis]